MLDKRPFYNILYNLKSDTANIPLIEAVEKVFDSVAPITDIELKALKQHPMQFVKRIPAEDGEWTTKLHVWAENGVKEILTIDPIYLGFKNSYGDSVLMCLTIAATGTHTNKVDHRLIHDILNHDYTYEETIKNADGNEETVVNNAMDETDIAGKTPIDYITEIAFSKGDYEGEVPDEMLQKMLYHLAGMKPDEIPEEIIPTISTFSNQEPAQI